MGSSGFVKLYYNVAVNSDLQLKLSFHLNGGEKITKIINAVQGNYICCLLICLYSYASKPDLKITRLNTLHYAFIMLIINFSRRERF